MSGHGPKHAPHKINPAAGYEETDAHAKPLVIFTIGLFFFTVASFIFSFYFYRGLEKIRAGQEPAAHPMAVERKLVDGVPRLQAHEALDLAAFRKTEDQVVDGYGWIDKDASVVRVPVEKAIDLVLAKKELKSRD